jgi:hypothetical protein
MRLNNINESPFRDTRAHTNRAPSGDGERMDFLSLPMDVQNRVLSERPQEDVLTAFKKELNEQERRLGAREQFVGGPQGAAFYIVQYKDRVEQAFWPNGRPVKFA